MIFFLTIFNILRLINSVVLITDAGAGNWIARSFLFEIGWQFGYGSFALYLIGIAQTLADSHKALASGWLPSPQTVDAIGLTFFFAPFVTNNVCSLATGFLANSNPYAAEVFVRMLYVLWFVHCFSLGTTVTLCGYRLVNVLNGYLEKFKRSGPRWMPLKNGIFKIKAVVGIIFICLESFATFLLLYGILRDTIIVNVVGSMVLSAIWNLLGALTTLAVEAAILFNPNTMTKKGGTFFGIKLSSTSDDKTGSASGYDFNQSTQRQTDMFDTQFSNYTNNHDNSYTGTLSHNAFSHLKQQGPYDFDSHFDQIDHSELEQPGAILASNVGIPLDDMVYQPYGNKVGTVSEIHLVQQAA
ncbi:hypothetical protein DM01DRAFT_1319638 [Hesseltinella vesiculosa]|uniref:Uncharacterized protein n=1 Tax=Hesseltinella vesiculosa TaxID=101127 RepID=A0A1X2GN32_9FUNG|nr:hypothetical protein DM01DRAFT_1319638 [Hesseltinella vesiculosa]